MWGLHKVFSIGKLAEVRLRSLQRKRICEVTDKLDGQMIMGVVVGTEVRMWSRKGAISDTAVGRTAGRVTDAGHRALVSHVAGTRCTPVFELVGQQSLLRGDEGKEPSLVLVADWLCEGTVMGCTGSTCAWHRWLRGSVSRWW